MILRPCLTPLGLPHFEKLRAGGNLPSPRGVALATLYAEDYAEVLAAAAAGGPAGLAGLEEEKFALNHRELTAAMLADWGVPDIFCVAVREASMADVDALIKRADEGAYLAKQQGRNRVASPQLCPSC